MRKLHLLRVITQEMLKKGFLASTSVYVCTEHSNEIIDRYIEALDPIWAKIKNCENGLVVCSKEFENLKIRHYGYDFEELKAVK